MVALLLAAALAHPTTAANHAMAQRAAAALLQRVELPAGAERLARPPGHAGGLLGRPSQVPGAEVVGRHRLWRVDQPLDSVLAFVKAHAPRGSRGDGSGSAGGPGVPANEELTFAFPPRAGRLALRWLEITLVALPGGVTGIRADSQVVWIVTRPRSEVVPAGVTTVDVDSHRVTVPATVATILRWFDALPTVQPGAAFSCPALVYGPAVTLYFRDAGGAVVARARMGLRLRNGSLLSTSCTSIQFSVGGRAETPLVGGRFFLRVEQLLGVKLR